MFDGWLASPGHRDNMRNGLFTDIGIGFVAGNAGTDLATYWTMVLAVGNSAAGAPIVILPPIADLTGPANLEIAQVAAVPLPPSFWPFVMVLTAGLLMQQRQAA